MEAGSLFDRPCAALDDGAVGAVVGLRGGGGHFVVSALWCAGLGKILVVKENLKLKVKRCVGLRFEKSSVEGKALACT